MDSEIVKERKKYVDITVSTKGCICGNVVGNISHSSEFMLKYGVEMSIEGGIKTSSRDGKLRRMFGWADTSNRNKTRIRIWCAWVERCFVRGWRWKR